MHEGEGVGVRIGLHEFRPNFSAQAQSHIGKEKLVQLGLGFSPNFPDGSKFYLDWWHYQPLFISIKTCISINCWCTA